MPAKTHLSKAELEANFADLYPAFSRDEARAEASRCLYCYDAPCTRSCPTGIDVPLFIRQILHDDPTGSARTILSENIFGGSCARACPTEVLCEGACVDRTLLSDPVQIGRLQRYATDFASDRGLRFFEAGADTGKRVAIVGSGPSGLSCAHTLRRFGHAVTVFEARDVPGGLNTLGIAPYKISTEFALTEIERVREVGMEIELGARIDDDRLQKLRREYDAVYLAVGLGSTHSLNLPGEDLDGVVEALDFIYQAHTGPLDECVTGENVLVIGAGNTAIDVATQAVRLGSKNVSIVYRRSDRDMSAFAYEYELARKDGINFFWYTEPIGFLGSDGRLTGLRVRSVRMQGEGRSASLLPVPDSERILGCDMAIKALGQAPIVQLLAKVDGLIFDRGRLVVDPATGITGVPGLFAGGDCTSAGAEIVDAVQEGKIAAVSIHEYLS